jgi:hypothetical protein
LHNIFIDIILDDHAFLLAASGFDVSSSRYLCELKVSDFFAEGVIGSRIPSEALIEVHQVSLSLSQPNENSFSITAVIPGKNGSKR